ncbi:MAG: lysine--tRNA ligase, partial [Thermoplasmata archaeon]
GILNLIDEYDREERAYFGKEIETRGMKDIRKTYELSQPHTVPKKPPYQIPYRHLVTLTQLGKNWDEIKQILLRTKQIPRNLDRDDEKRLKQRTEHARYWLKKFAPDTMKFELQKKKPDIHLTDEQKRFISRLTKTLSNIEWEAEKIHNAIYKTAEKENMQIKTAFKTIYQLLLNQEKGPRAGYFLSNLDKKFVINRLKETVK